jgi:hypothetical protein
MGGSFSAHKCGVDKPDDCSAGTVNMPWWEGKQKIREYLEQINKPNKVCSSMVIDGEANSSARS